MKEQEKIAPGKPAEMKAGRVCTHEEWLAEGKRLFGEDFTKWRFKCPKCGHVATGQDFKDAGLKPDIMYSCCIGRFKPGVGCDWAAYGLFDICTVHVMSGEKLIPVFEFAPIEKGGEA